MKRVIIKLLLFFTILIFSSCSNSESIEDIQSDFQSKALEEPNQITSTDIDGNITGQTDSDDWRVGPLFEEIVKINPPFPNPALSSEDISLEINVMVEDTLSDILVYSGHKSLDSLDLVTIHFSSIPSNDVIEIPMDPYKISGDKEDVNGIYRIIIMDKKGDFISYGDVEIIDAQEIFETTAFSSPNAFTQTDRNGAIVNKDNDDWRIAPIFQGDIFVNPPFPNPITNDQDISFTILFTGNTINGLKIWNYTSQNQLQLITNIPNNSPGTIFFQLDTSDLSNFSGSPNDLYRIIITDNADKVISYGDIKLN